MDNYTQQVKLEIEKLAYNQIFVASEFKEQNLQTVPDKTYYKVLERLTKQEEIVHLSKGLYYKPYIENGKFRPISDDDIIDYYVKDHEGIVVGDKLLDEAGVLNDSSNRVQIYSKKLKENRKRVSDIEIQKIDVELNDETISIIETLEILQNYGKGKNRDKERFVAYFKKFAERYSDDAAEYVLSRMKYKKSTIAFLERMLIWYGVFNSLSNHLSPLSQYKIPSIDELRLQIPVKKILVLNEYVEEIKKIYSDSLTEVKLYGSYAKGNFTYESDMDIMILVSLSENEIKGYRHSLTEKTYDFNSENDVDIKPMVKNVDEFEKWSEVYPFYSNVKKEGVVLYRSA